MTEILKVIKTKFESGLAEDCVEGIELASSEVKKIVELTLGLLTNSNYDKVLIAERVTTIFDTYLKKLIEMIENKESAFWASCLLVHHQVKYIKANQILLEAVKKHDTEKALLAATILTRVRDFSLIDAINERLKNDTRLDSTVKEVLRSKVEILNNER